jgi:hypothetical protein
MHVSGYIIMLVDIVEDSQFFVKTARSVVLLVVVILLGHFANTLSII